ncbi:hypothetical protein KOI35_28285 [Actinoplanes bogorensis]|uniref:Uncharacterized protein n=1 Tax=Paractinoplanes bogorensis TaxID=1610840 RepID=A0ABS5YVC9_9ACTN|nr:SitI3 family protein [Actinoplanes bogorensis]MBU2667417.1 hypothetical protein [Actinoplanes bogorensis]
MALEYDWSGDTDIDMPALRAFIATATGGSQHPDGTVFLDGMYITARTVSDDDSNPAMKLFGFDERFTSTFRFANTADDATTDHNIALMAHVLITFAQSRKGRGILLHNGEKAVLQYGEHGIVFDSEWEDWTSNGKVAPLLTSFLGCALPQPLL